jgi:hypothetical protein
MRESEKTPLASKTSTSVSPQNALVLALNALNQRNKPPTVAILMRLVQ